MVRRVTPFFFDPIQHDRDLQRNARRIRIYARIIIALAILVGLASVTIISIVAIHFLSKAW